MLQDLPQELLFFIFSFMDLRNLSRLAMVCYLTYRIARDPRLLKRLTVPRLKYSASHNMKALLPPDKNLVKTFFQILPHWRIAIIPAHLPVIIRDMRSNRLLSTLPYSLPLSSIAGSLILPSKQLVIAYTNGLLRVWNTDTFEHKTYQIGEHGITSISRLAKHRIAISNFNNNVLIWDLKFGQHVRSLLNNTTPKGNRVKVLPNNEDELVVTFNNPTTIRSPVLYYNQETFKPEFSLQDYEGSLQCIVSWSDGNQAGCATHCIYIFEYTGKVIRQLDLGNNKSHAVNLMILPNGFLLSAYRNTLQIWHNYSWKCITTFKLHEDCKINYLGIAESGDVIIGCADGSLRAWKFPTLNHFYWKSQQHFPEHPGKNLLTRDRIKDATRTEDNVVLKVVDVVLAKFDIIK